MARWARATVERPPLSEPPAAAAGTPADREPIAERRLRGAELALRGARRELERAREQLMQLGERVAELEGQLEQARAEPARLRELLRASERLRREAEQVADAERRERERLERLLASARHQRAGEQANESEPHTDTLARRVGELERQLRERTRELDELEHLLVVARRARDRAQARAAELQAELRGGDDRPPASVSVSAAVTALATEGALARRALQIGTARPMLVAGAAQMPFAAALAAERALTAAMAARGGRSAGVMATEGRDLLSAADGAQTALTALADEFDALAELARRERDERRRAQDRVAELELELRLARRAGNRALQVTEMLAEELRTLGAGAAPTAADAQARTFGARPPQPAVLPEHPAGPVEPEMLNAALNRLRSGPCSAFDEHAALASSEPRAPSAPGEAGVPEAPREPKVQQAPVQPAVQVEGEGAPHAVGPWLRRAVRRLAGRDPAAAGELALALMPLARAPGPRPVAFDLLLGESQCLQVSVSDTAAEVRASVEPRSPEQVAARITASAPQLGRLLGAGALARLFGRAPVRLQGSREALRVLRALPNVRVRLGELPDRGVHAPAELLLKLVAAMLTPGITGKAALTIVHHEPDGSRAAFLSVRDGQPPQAGELTPGVMSSLTVWCDSDTLLRLLDGHAAPELLGARVEGAVDNLERLRGWIERAQGA